MGRAYYRNSGRYHPQKIDIYLHELSVGTRHKIVNKTIGKNRHLLFGGILKRNQTHDQQLPFFIFFFKRCKSPLLLNRIIAQPLLNENSLFSQELSTNPHVENVDSVENFEDNIISN